MRAAQPSWSSICKKASWACPEARRIRSPPWWPTARACSPRPGRRERSPCWSMWAARRMALTGCKPPPTRRWKTTGPLPPDWSELIPELDRQPGDMVILKRQWGAFYGTDLDLQLRRRGLDDHRDLRHRHRVRRGEHGPRRLRARLRADLRRGCHDRHERRKPREQRRAHLSPPGPRALHRGDSGGPPCLSGARIRQPDS